MAKARTPTFSDTFLPKSRRGHFLLSVSITPRRRCQVRAVYTTATARPDPSRMSSAARPMPLETRSLSVLSEVAVLEDEEKAFSVDNKEVDASVNSTPSSKDSLEGVVAAHGAFARLTRYLAHLGVETRSTERIPEDERDQVRSSPWVPVGLVGVAR